MTRSSLPDRTGSSGGAPTAASSPLCRRPRSTAWSPMSAHFAAAATSSARKSRPAWRSTSAKPGARGRGRALRRNGRRALRNAAPAGVDGEGASGPRVGQGRHVRALMGEPPFLGASCLRRRRFDRRGWFLRGARSGGKRGSRRGAAADRGAISAAGRGRRARLARGECVTDLNLWPIGNCQVSALVDDACRAGLGVPAAGRRRSGLLLLASGRGDPPAMPAGEWRVELEDQVRAEPRYLKQHPDPRHPADRRATAAAVDVIDFCPRFERSGRMYRPVAFVRLVRPRRRARRGSRSRSARAATGARAMPSAPAAPTISAISDRAAAAAADHRRAGRPSARGPQFRLEQPHPFLPRPRRAVRRRCRARRSRRCCTRPPTHWRQWVRGLAIPLEWQEAVIRAAITLKLCQHEETGAIVAALTTSIPEQPEVGPQLGLSLLLDPRRLLHRPGAEPAGRARHAGKLSLLSAQHRRPGAAAAQIQPLYACRASRR